MNNNEVVSIHSELFEKNKNALKNFSKKMPKKPSLPWTEETALLLFERKASGKDVNDLRESVQDKLIEHHDVMVKIIKEFNTIYDTFNVLDKEYIQGILTSLKATDAVNSKIISEQKNIKKAQSDIDNVIKQLSVHVNVLKAHKDKIDAVMQGVDVNKLKAFEITYDKCMTVENTNKKMVGDINKINDTTASLDKRCSKFEKLVEQNHKNTTLQVERLKQDTERNRAETNKQQKYLNTIQEDIQNQRAKSAAEISELKNTFLEQANKNDEFEKTVEQYKKNASLQVETLKQDTERNRTEISKQQKCLNATQEDIQNQREKSTAEISDLKEMLLEQNNKSNKLQMALIALSVLVVIQFVLLFKGV